jgi:hypothetical protein
MITLTLTLVLAVLLSAVVRRHGYSKLISIGGGIAPALLVFLVALVRRDLDVEIGPHIGIYPAWKATGAVLALSTIASTVTACLVRKP